MTTEGAGKGRTVAFGIPISKPVKGANRIQDVQMLQSHQSHQFLHSDANPHSSPHIEGGGSRQNSGGLEGNQAFHKRRFSRLDNQSTLFGRNVIELAEGEESAADYNTGICMYIYVCIYMYVYICMYSSIYTCKYIECNRL
jgi:hypothetical protein